MRQPTYKYKNDGSWPSPHKYMISFNDGLEECKWWVTVMDDKSYEGDFYPFFYLQIGVDVAFSCTRTSHNIEKTDLTHEDVIKLMTKDLTREMAFLGEEDCWLFNLTIMSTNALYNYLKNHKGLSNSQIIMTGDEVHTEFLVPGIIDRLELSDEQLRKIGRTKLLNLLNVLDKEEFDRLFSNEFILKNFEFENWNIEKFTGRGIEKEAIKSMVKKSSNIPDTIRRLENWHKNNEKILKHIKEAEMEALISQ